MDLKLSRDSLWTFSKENSMKSPQMKFYIQFTAWLRDFTVTVGRLLVCDIWLSRTPNANPPPPSSPPLFALSSVWRVKWNTIRWKKIWQIHVWSCHGNWCTALSYIMDFAFVVCAHTRTHTHTLPSKQCVLDRFLFLFPLFVFSSMRPVVVGFVVVVIVACEQYS